MTKILKDEDCSKVAKYLKVTTTDNQQYSSPSSMWFTNNPKDGKIKHFNKPSRFYQPNQQRNQRNQQEPQLFAEGSVVPMEVYQAYYQQLYPQYTATATTTATTTQSLKTLLHTYSTSTSIHNTIVHLKSLYGLKKPTLQKPTLLIFEKELQDWITEKNSYGGVDDPIMKFRVTRDLTEKIYNDEWNILETTLMSSEKDKMFSYIPSLDSYYRDRILRYTLYFATKENIVFYTNKLKTLYKIDLPKTNIIYNNETFKRWREDDTKDDDRKSIKSRILKNHTDKMNIQEELDNIVQSFDSEASSSTGAISGKVIAKNDTVAPVSDKLGVSDESSTETNVTNSKTTLTATTATSTKTSDSSTPATTTTTTTIVPSITSVDDKKPKNCNSEYIDSITTIPSITSVDDKKQKNCNSEYIDSITTIPSITSVDDKKPKNCNSEYIDSIEKWGEKDQAWNTCNDYDQLDKIKTSNNQCKEIEENIKDDVNKYNLKNIYNCSPPTATSTSAASTTKTTPAPPAPAPTNYVEELDWDSNNDSSTKYKSLQFKISENQRIGQYLWTNKANGKFKKQIDKVYKDNLDTNKGDFFEQFVKQFTASIGFKYEKDVDIQVNHTKERKLITNKSKERKLITNKSKGFSKYVDTKKKHPAIYFPIDQSLKKGKDETEIETILKGTPKKVSDSSGTPKNVSDSSSTKKPILNANATPFVFKTTKGGGFYERLYQDTKNVYRYSSETRNGKN